MKRFLGCITMHVVQGALSELYAPAPSPTVPVLAAPPFSMMAPGGLGRHPNGMGDMRLSEETAGGHHLCPLTCRASCGTA